MAKRVNVVGAKPKEIKVADQSKRRIEPEELAAALGANPSGAPCQSDMDPIALAEFGTQLINRLRSSGGRPALEGAQVNCRVPLSAEDLDALGKIICQIEQTLGTKPTVGQLASVMLRAQLSRSSADRPLEPQPKSIRSESPLSDEMVSPPAKGTLQRRNAGGCFFIKPAA
jgi:hypothetical protein